MLPAKHNHLDVLRRRGHLPSLSETTRPLSLSSRNLFSPSNPGTKYGRRAGGRLIQRTTSVVFSFLFPPSSFDAGTICVRLPRLRLRAPRRSVPDLRSCSLLVLSYSYIHTNEETRVAYMRRRIIVYGLLFHFFSRLSTIQVFEMYARFICKC